MSDAFERVEARCAQCEPTPLSHLLTAEKLRRLADLMDELNRRRGYEYGPAALEETDVQDDLRKWADGLEAGTVV